MLRLAIFACLFAQLGCGSDASSGADVDVADVADASNDADVDTAAVLACEPPDEAPPTAICDDPAAQPASGSCSSNHPVAPLCGTNADCADGETCVLAAYGTAFRCSCSASGCVTDADCGAGEVCACGAVVAGARCGANTGVPCGNTCVPADCRVDADCPTGQVCRVSRSVCRFLGGYHCVDPAAPTAPCEGDLESCTFRDGAGWRCEPGPICN
ncbi:MAG: hypothetical protein KC635_06845 [Myxococcales bacterium]|nr:hypothetical protein [Myxococcales bacterium]MCB9735021.1 hypothetical protein [Deltaproteobacteria bacterium]